MFVAISRSRYRVLAREPGAIHDRPQHNHGTTGRAEGAGRQASRQRLVGSRVFCCGSHVILVKWRGA